MKLQAACLKTHNIEKMVDFYTRLFGAAPEIDGGVDHRFYPWQLVVFQLEDPDEPATEHAALIYAVEDVDAEYARLAAGVAGAPPTDKPWGVRSFVVEDPDGNTISFFKNL